MENGDICWGVDDGDGYTSFDYSSLQDLIEEYQDQNGFKVGVGSIVYYSSIKLVEPKNVVNNNLISTIVECIEDTLFDYTNEDNSNFNPNEDQLQALWHLLVKWLDEVGIEGYIAENPKPYTITEKDLNPEYVSEKEAYESTIAKLRAELEEAKSTIVIIRGN